LNTTPGASTSVTFTASFANTLADIANSLALGLIDNAGIADALSGKINAATQALAVSDIPDAIGALQAFNNQVNAQTGKHLTGVAPQILHQDANSLLSQLSTATN
jgi:hypothetical protein